MENGSGCKWMSLTWKYQESPELKENSFYNFSRQTCSNDFNPASLPHTNISFKINCLTSGFEHNTLKVPGILLSLAQFLITSTSGTTIATTQLWKIRGELWNQSIE
jgi:hypothetical protein